jgi:hypothetical protein
MRGRVGAAPTPTRGRVEVGLSEAAGASREEHEVARV